MMSSKHIKKRILFLIPARGGSQRLPAKNIIPLAGRPLIAWTIKSAKASRYTGTVVVSTDDKKIANVAKHCGAQVPFLRPKSLARSASKTEDVILHALEYFKKLDREYDLIVLLQPTSPLRTSADIDRAIELFYHRKANAVVSVSHAEHHPSWITSLTRTGLMKSFMPKMRIQRNGHPSPCYYRLNGAIYIASVPFILKKKTFVGRRTYAYIMPIERSVDIDTVLDYQMAKLLMKSTK